MTTVASDLDEAELARRLAIDTPYYCEITGLTIAPKMGPRIVLHENINQAQVEFDAKLMAQRAAGLPQRAIILKARQVGMSTWCQTKMIQRSTRMPNHQALTVAHDTKTGNKLYRMGQGIHASLPMEQIDGHPIKPPIRSTRRGRHLHFAQPDQAAWFDGTLWPNSEYDVDTANEYDAGRGGTFHSLHLSELAFWGDAETKLGGLKACVPRDPDTLVVIESTANGHNEFKDAWDLAVKGESGYVPFFWPWWRHEEYRVEFISTEERMRFRIGDHKDWGEAEAELAQMMEGQGYDELAVLEKLNWRRMTIADEASGDLSTFKQEYPATPDEAFIGTGSRVFDAERVQVLIARCEEVNAENPPLRGQLRAGGSREEEGRAGVIEIPESPLWVPRDDLEVGVPAPWSMWTGEDGISVGEDDELVIPKDRHYLVNVDVSGGEVEEGGKEPAMHAIEVIDHLSGDQVAEYASRIDPHLLTREVFLAALLFNDAWVAIERTGGWGLPVLRTLYYDFHYTLLYRHRKQGQAREKTDQRLGWNTDPKSKPMIVAGGKKLLNMEITGIRSPVLARELLHYVFNPEKPGEMQPEPGHFFDRGMAWLIGQQVRLEIPVPDDEDDEGGSEGGVVETFRPRDPQTGY